MHHWATESMGSFHCLFVVALGRQATCPLGACVIKALPLCPVHCICASSVLHKPALLLSGGLRPLVELCVEPAGLSLYYSPSPGKDSRKAERLGPAKDFLASSEKVS